jgi:general secretion pathway protein D
MTIFFRMQRPVVAALVVICALVASPLLRAQEGQWSINLRDADIRTFIDQVSAMTGKTFVIDQRVKGKITVIAPESMNSATVYQVFLSVLSVNGFAAVPTGRVIKIVPDGNAKQDSIPLDTSEKPSGDAMITRVISVNNSPAAELVPVLRPLVPQGGHMAAVTGANVLVVTDHAENVSRLEQVIARIDGADADDLEVVQLKSAWVGDVVDVLGSFSSGAGEAGKAASRAGGNTLTAGRVKIVADERTNRLILRGDVQARARLKKIIDTVDVPAEATSGSVHVLRLRHADAKKTADILKGMVDGGGSSSSASSGKDAGATALLNPASGKIAIQADESLNALVVRADPTVMQQIRALVAQLDVRRAQILIEAAIVEVGGTTGRELGVQMASGSEDSGIIGVNFSGVGRSINDIASSLISPTTSRGLADGLTVAGGKRDSNGDVSFGGVVQALASNANVNLLSTPSVLTLDNQEAKIIVGENVPFITGSSSSAGDGTSNPFTTIKREDVGIQLKVTPTLIDDDNVKLVINQEVSSVKPSQDGVQSSDIITSKRSIATTVLAGNRQTVVLGGLIEDRVTETVKKVPLLGDIPVIGILFRSKGVSRGKQNLMVFLRPTVLNDNAATEELSRQKYGGVRTLSFEINSRGDIARLQSEEVLPAQVGGLFSGLNGPEREGKEPAEGSNAASPVAAGAAPPAPAEAPPSAEQAEPSAETSPASSPAAAEPAAGEGGATESAAAPEGGPAASQSVQ